jgi:hypothetical protein
MSGLIVQAMDVMSASVKLKEAGVRNVRSRDTPG